MKKDTIVKIFIAVEIYGIIWDLLKVSGFITISHDTIYSLLFSLALVTAVLFMSSHHYWMHAFLFQGFHRAARFFAASIAAGAPSVFFVVSRETMLVLLIGILCSMISTYFLFRLLKEETFKFRGMTEKN